VDRRDAAATAFRRIQRSERAAYSPGCHALTVALSSIWPDDGLGWPLVGCRHCADAGSLNTPLVSPQDLSKLDVAFFNMNGYHSITVLAATLLRCGCGDRRIK